MVSSIDCLWQITSHLECHELCRENCCLTVSRLLSWGTGSIAPFWNQGSPWFQSEEVNFCSLPWCWFHWFQVMILPKPKGKSLKMTITTWYYICIKFDLKKNGNLMPLDWFLILQPIWKKCFRHFVLLHLRQKLRHRCDPFAATERHNLKSSSCMVDVSIELGMIYPNCVGTSYRYNIWYLHIAQYFIYVYHIHINSIKFKGHHITIMERLKARSLKKLGLGIAVVGHPVHIL